VNERKLIFCRLVLKQAKLVKYITPAGKLFQTFAVGCDVWIYMGFRGEWVTNLLFLGK